MDNMYNQGRNQHTIPGVLRDPSGRVVQPQPISYETTPIPENDIQSSLLPHHNVQSSFLPDDSAQNSSSIPGGAITFIKARPSAPPEQPEQSLSQPGSLPVPPRTISQKVRADPYYQLLAVAIVAVLIASSVLAAFLATGSLGAIAHHTTPNQPLAKAQVTTTAQSTRGHTTTTPKPTPTRGPTQANPPATPQPTQSPSNPGSTPPPNPVQNNLTVQFVNLPYDGLCYMYDNDVTVQTQPGATVELNTGVSQQPPMQQTANNNGMATFTFYVGDSYGDMVNLVATAQNNGQQGQAQTSLELVFGC